MIEAVTDAGLPPAHVGLQAGQVVLEGGDYFGHTVNVAARIAEHATAGQVLVSDDVAETIDRERFTATAIGPVRLKGVADPVELYAVERRT